MAGNHRLLSVPPAVGVSSVVVSTLSTSPSASSAIESGTPAVAIQIGLPATAGPTGQAVWLLVTTVIALGLGLHVYRDALARDVSHPRAWGVLTGVLLVGTVVPGVACYLLYRLFRRRTSRRPPRRTGPERGHS